MSLAQAIVLSSKDNVAVANGRIEPGTELPGGVKALSAIDPGHKVAILPIKAGEAVVKYAQAIGRATEDIAPGTHIHSHNLVFESGRMPVVPPSDPVQASDRDKARTFMGYRRADGRAGTRNFVGIIASVNCSTTVCRAIAERANRELLPEYPGIDGFVPIVHDQGCGMSGTGEGMQVLHRTLAGYARHPNFGGILMIGLGCEVNQLTLYGQKGIAAGKRHFNIQESGGSRKSVERAMGVLREICEEVGPLKREPIPVSEIVVGLQCGGSDGMSGITANPALGAAVDILAAGGGTGILSETTEIYGAEHLLASRATTPEVAAKLDGLIKWWEAHVQKHGASIDNNPSPGNKRGGLTTILEKSLGAVAKGGTAPLSGVYKFAEPITTPGFVYMDSPGYDPCSATGQIASGATMIVFTTGRGSVSGFKPSPCIKLATNNEMYQRMAEDMDINCGDIIDGVSIEAKGAEILEKVIAVASGQRTLSEELGFGGAEFVPWQIGAVM